MREFQRTQNYDENVLKILSDEVKFQIRLADERK